MALRQRLFATLATLLLCALPSAVLALSGSLHHQGSSLEVGVEFRAVAQFASASEARESMLAVVLQSTAENCTVATVAHATAVFGHANASAVDKVFVDALFIAPSEAFHVCAVNRSAVTHSLRTITGLSSISPAAASLHFVAHAGAEAGDFAAIQLLGPSNYTFVGMTANSQLGGGDVLKVVTAGTPCSANISSGCVGRASLTIECVGESTHHGGVARLGSRTIHPLNTDLSEVTATSGHAVAFVQLPTAGSYELCFSAAAWRVAGAPAWRKLSNAAECNVSDANVASCSGYVSQMAVSDASTATSWAARDLTEDTWGTVRISGANLSSFAAVGADCPSCSNVDYWASAAGDALRVVPQSVVSSTPVPPTQHSVASYVTSPIARGGAAASAGCWDTSLEVANSAAASYDLGADDRSALEAHLVNESMASGVAAFLKFPAAGDYVVCYRSSSSSSWRAIGGVLTTTSLEASVYAPSKLGVRLNDTRAATHGALAIFTSDAIVPLTASTFFDSTVADGDVRSMMVRLVAASSSCSTGDAFSTVTDLGTRECHPAECNFASDCGLGQCYGINDGSLSLVNEAFAYIAIPNEDFRVCVRHNTANWYAADTIAVLPASDLVFEMGTPASAGSLLRVSVKHSGTHSHNRMFDVRSATLSAGDMLRIVDATATTCAHSWLPSTPETYNTTTTVVDLGVDCSGTPTASECAEWSPPMDGAVVAVAPYESFNVSYDGQFSAAGSVGFVRIPGSLAGRAFTLCYKQPHLNWVALPHATTAAVTSTAAATVECTSSGTTTLFAGAVGRLFVSCNTELNVTTTIVKLASGLCSGIALGGTARHQAYATLTTTNTSQGNAQLVTVAGSTMSLEYLFAAPQTSTGVTARVCVMPDGTGGQANWLDAGAVSVAASNLYYTPPVSLFHGQTVALTIGSSAAGLDTRRGQDAAKVVRSTDPCAAATDPIVANTGLSSHDVGTETATGVTDLGPTDEVFASLATMRSTVPGSAMDTACYKVCYWLSASSAWIEVPAQTEGDTSSFCAVAAPADHLVIGSRLIAPAAANSSAVSLAAGAATGWKYLLTNTLTQDAGPIGTADEYLIRLPDSSAATGGRLKFVVVAAYEAPNWVRTEGATCADAAAPQTDNVDQVSNGFSIDVPTQAGTYLVCWSPNGGAGWIAVNLKRDDGSELANPINVTSSALSFQVTSEGVITVLDSARDGMQSSASLSSNDIVYLTNLTASCGDAAPWFGGELVSTGVTSAAQQLSEGTAAATRSTMPNASAVPSSSYPGVYKLCLFKTADTNSPVSRNVFYRVPTNAAGSLHVVGGGSTVELTCPSAAISMASTVSFNVFNGAGVMVSHSGAVVTGGNVALASTGDECPAGRAASFGAPADAVEIAPGLTSVVVSAQSECASDCTISVAVDGLSAQCNVSVDVDVVTSLSVSGPTSCHVFPGGDAGCEFQVIARTASGSLAVRSAATVTLSPQVSSAVSWSGTATAVTSGGMAHLTLRPTGSSADSVVTVVAAVGNVTASATVLVPRAAVEALQIVDLRASVPSPSVPEWEPTESAGSSGVWPAAPTMLSSRYSDAAHQGGFLTAGEYYALHLQAIANGSRVTDASVLQRFPVSLSLQSTNGSTVEDNVIIGQVPSGSSLDSYMTALTPTAFAADSSGAISIVFRVMNSNGCRVEQGGCRLVASSGSASASIHTFVRSEAVALQAHCRSAGDTMAQMADTCDGTVEGGFEVRVQAVDQFGAVDEFYEGAVALEFHPADVSELPSKAALSTVTSLAAGAAAPTRVTATIVRGVVVIPGLSASAPSNARVLVTPLDWSGAPAIFRIRTRPSTTQLRCEADTASLVALDANGTSVSVTTLSDALVYGDTQLCFTVHAANAAGSATLYETNWAYFYLTGPSNAALVAREAGLLPRFAPMRRSTARFCLVVNGLESGTATFSVGFGVQEFGTDASGATSWTINSGRCSVGPFTLRATKVVHHLQAEAVTSSTLAEMPVARRQMPTSRPWLWGQHQLPLSDAMSREMTATLSFRAADHYGNSAPLPSGSRVVVEGCGFDQMVGGSCAAGHGGTASGAVRVRSDIDVRDGGMLSVRVVSSTASSVTIAVSRACLRCEVRFHLQLSDGSTLADAGTALEAAATLSVVLPTTGSHRYVAFAAATSPFLTGAWAAHSAAAPASPADSTSTIATFVHSDCVAAGSSCALASSRLPEASCANSSAPHVLAADRNGAHLRAGVFMSVASTGAIANGAGACGSASDVAACLTSGANTVHGHWDIFTSYTLTATVGSAQLLRCADGASCRGTANASVSIECPAAGATVSGALLAVENVTEVGMSLLATGVLPSSSYTEDSSGMPSTTPSVSGAFEMSSSAVSDQVAAPAILTSNSASLTGREGSYVLQWRGAAHAANLVVRKSATSEGCVSEPSTMGWVDGYSTATTLSELDIEYAERTFETGVSIPITVDLATVASEGRAIDARGTVSAAIASFSGCGNGGSLNVTGGTIAHGRATVHVSFSAPCEHCVLRLSVTRSSDDVALGQLAAIPGALSVLTRPLAIVASRFGAVGMVVSHTAANGNRRDHVVGEAAGQVDLGLMARQGSSHVMSVAASTSGISASVRVLNRVTRRVNVVLMGNGGRLSSTAAPMFTPVTAALSAATPRATVAFGFTRPCSSCEVVVAWDAMSPAGRTSGSFQVRHSSGTVFTAAAPYTGVLIAGRPQRTVHVRSPMVIVARSTAGLGWARDAPVASGALNFALSVLNSTNGDGGSPTVTSFAHMNGARQVLITSPTPCALCNFSMFGHAVTAGVVTTATHVRVESLTATNTSVAAGFGVRLALSDDSGFVDVTIGGPQDCRLHHRFLCQSVVLPTVQMQLSNDGLTVGGFTPTQQDLTVGGSDTILSVSLTNALVRDGRASDLHAAVTTPLRGLTPIFTVEEAGLSTTNRTRTIPSVDIYDPSTGPIELAVVRTQYNHHTLTPLEVIFGVGRRFGVNNRNYVASQVDSSVAVTYSDACGTQTQTTATISRGLGTVALLFDAATPASAPCVVTFRLAGGLDCTACTASTSIVVSAPPLTGFEWLRPTPIENGGANEAAGPRFAAAGRVLTASLRGVSTVSGATLPIRRCTSGCDATLTVETANCSVAPLSIVKHDHMAVNGSVDFVVTWPNSAVAGNCRLQATLMRSSTTVTTQVVPISLCVPHHVVAGNLSVSSSVLHTGTTYEWLATMVDADGMICRGDSQQQGTLLALSAVAEDGSPTDVRAVNTDVTSAVSTLLGTATVVRALGGQFRFRVVLTAPSQQPLRLRVEAQSLLPSLSSAAQSPPFSVVVKASRLRLRPDTVPPQNIVRGRPLRGAGGSNLMIQAVDAIPNAWATFAPGVPNIDRLGVNTAEWIVDPASKPFPLSFVTGSRLQGLSLGEAETLWNFTGPDGRYNLVIRDADGQLADSDPMVVNVQAVARAAMRTGSLWCSSSCQPEGFSARTGTPGYVMQEGNMYTVDVAALDESGNVVIGDDETVVGLRLLLPATSTSSPRLRHASVSSSYGPLVLPLREGRASFSFAFEGTTARADGGQDAVRLEIFCPRLASGVNHCANVASFNASTSEFVISNSVVTVNINAELQRYLPTIKLAMSLSNISAFNSTAFRQSVLANLLAAGPTVWPQQAQAVSYLRLTACEVDASTFGSGDLEGAVCGVSSRCTSPFDSTCPAGVRICECPPSTAASTMSARDASSRRLQQLPTVTTPALSLQAELTFALQASDVTTFTDIAAMYVGVSQTVVNALRTDAVFRDTYGVDTAGITVVQRNTEVTTLSPPPSTMQSTVAATAPPATTPPPISSAPPLGGSLLIAIAALFAAFIAI